MRKDNILVTAIGAFAADIVIRTLQEHKYNVIGTDIYPMQWIANSRMVDCFYQVPEVKEKRKYIDTILNICKKENVRWIFPLTDVEVDVLNSCRRAFENLGIILCMSSYESIKICRDKRKTSEVLSDMDGIEIIPQYTARDIVQEKVKLPIICKKIDGRSSQGLRKINHISEFKLFQKYNERDSYIIQPFIEGNILTVDVVRDAKHDSCIAVVRKELLRTLNGAGTSVYVFNDCELETLCKRIAKKLDIIGCVNFEFIDTGKKRYFLECNPRFSGGVKFTCMSGYDCIMNHLFCFKGEKIEDEKEIVSQYIARKYDEYIMSVNNI